MTVLTGDGDLDRESVLSRLAAEQLDPVPQPADRFDTTPDEVDPPPPLPDRADPLEAHPSELTAESDSCPAGSEQTESESDSEAPFFV